MMRLSHITSLAGSLLLAACTGQFTSGDDPGGDPVEETPAGDATPRQLFDGLHGALISECSSCHLGTNDEVSLANGPDYMGADSGADAVYAAIMSASSTLDTATPLVHNAPANSKLYFYGSVAHSGSTGMTATLKSQIEAWIIAEAEADGITPDPGGDDVIEPGGPVGEPKTIMQALTMFASCMRYEDFALGEFPNIANIQVNGGERCHECHGVGESGAYLSDIEQLFYTGQRSLDVATSTLKADPGLYSFIAVRPLLDGSLEIVQTKRYEMKQENNGNHPNYNFDGYIDDVEAFYQATYTRYLNSIAAGIACTPDNPVP